MTYYKHVGTALEIIRSEANYSQQRIAEEMNVSREQYRKYASGENRLPLDKMALFCKEMEISIAHFFEVAEIEKEKENGSYSRRARRKMLSAKDKIALECLREIFSFLPKSGQHSFKLLNGKNCRLKPLCQPKPHPDTGEVYFTYDVWIDDFPIDHIEFTMKASGHGGFLSDKDDAETS